MALKFYNALTRKKQIFRPLHNKRVGLYTCGPTVYNYAHIGNWRTYVFEDVLKRTLKYNGCKVKHVMNITDVEDKIIRGAKKTGKEIYEFTEPYEKAFYTDLKKLNIEKAHRYPKATAHIPEMIKIISALLKKGLAYKAAGSVYFDISKFKKYGRLSGVKSRELKAGTRVDADEYTKEEAEDFVLWKKAEAGEPWWRAPFGEGRPGWHIECSAMSMKYLGKTFDIHAGAVDLIFPHHENEIAQSEGATGKLFVKYFIEGEHLLVDGKKMSKSLGDIYTLRDIEAKGFSPLDFRYLILTAHYRSKLNFTWKSLKAARNALDKLREAVLKIKKEVRLPKSDFEIPKSQTSNIKVGLLTKFRTKFLSYINNDLEMPRALALLWNIIKSKELNAEKKLNLVADFDEIFGLNLAKITAEKIKIPEKISELIKEREKCRKEKNFKKADEIRQKIESLGWLIEDTPSGSKLKRK